jgi:predicted phosphoribosyltransferase
MFRNREDAAMRLAERLRGRVLRDPLVLGIPRGGVVLGAVLARELGADLDVVLARKLRAPDQPELALGALAESGEVYLEPHVEPTSSWLQAYLAEEYRRQREEIERRQFQYREGRPPARVEGRSVIVTDDGIATGSTMIAALQAVRTQRASQVIAAVPVGPPDRLEEVGRWCDELVCLFSPPDFVAVGTFYGDFTPVGDEEVVHILRTFRRAEEAGKAPLSNTPQTPGPG